MELLQKEEISFLLIFNLGSIYLRNSDDTKLKKYITNLIIEINYLGILFLFSMVTWVDRNVNILSIQYRLLNALYKNI